MLRNNNIRELILYSVRYKKSLMIVMFSLSIVALALLSIGFVFRYLIDYGLSNNNSVEINNSIYLLIGLIIIFSVGSFLRSYFINSVALNISSKIKLDAYKNLLKQDVIVFENLKIGNLISILSTDVELVNNLIVTSLSFLIRNSIMLFGALILMFFNSVKLSLMVVVTIPLILLPLIKLSKSIRQMSKISLEKQGNLSANIEETISGIRTISAFNKQQYMAQKFISKVDEYIDFSSLRLKYRSIFFASAIACVAGAITFIIWMGSVDIISGNITSGQMMSFIYYAIIVGFSAGGILETVSELQIPLAALDRLLELKCLNKLDNDTIENKDFSSIESINFNKVKFSYPSRPENLILDSISLNIERGKFTAIIGKSGSGKSTILQLLVKFYDNYSGIIKINDKINLELIDPQYIRAKIAYVEQDPSIFSGTFRSNIELANPDISDSKIDKILQLCGLKDLVSNMKDGINTEIGQKGVRLSGGQQQRIAIARALAYDPEILLLDEATSALDNESEKEILANIKKFMKKKTIVSITHRVASIEDADNILLIDKGNLVAEGKHSKLIQNSDLYKILHQQGINNN